MPKNVLLSALVLAAVGCVVHVDDDVCAYDEHYSCYLQYTPYFGYERVCEWVSDPVSCIDEPDDYARYRRPSGVSNGSGSEDGSEYPAPAEPHAGQPHAGPPSGPAADAGAPNAGDAGAGEAQPGESASEEATSSEGDGSAEPGCSRDSQCGTGLCVEEQCFYSCEASTDCGTGDVCLESAGTLVCREPETPQLECARNSDCGSDQVCLNAVCHDGCETTADCNHQLDRCAGAICVPDRSVVSECLLDRECPSGQACLDAACQPR